MVDFIWRCPHCGQALDLVDRQYRCAQGHSFDRAKEGYVNLLPVNRRGSRQPGDDKDMLRHRRAFLDQGHYRPLVDRLTALCIDQKRRVSEGPYRLLDTGCGEGYYTGIIAAALRESEIAGGLAAAGIDIAREAARMAAKRHPDIRFAVASNADLPVADASLDCALRVFAPAANREIVRVLKPGGCFISVTPGARHLFELRALVYDRPQEHPTRIDDIERLRHRRRENLDFQLDLQGQGGLAKLFAMTPYYWQASAEKQASINGLERLNVSISFCIDCYRKD